MSLRILFAAACLMLLAAPSFAQQPSVPAGSTFFAISDQGNALYRAPDGSYWMGPKPAPRTAPVFLPQFGVYAPAAAPSCASGQCPRK